MNTGIPESDSKIFGQIKKEKKYVKHLFFNPRYENFTSPGVHFFNYSVAEWVNEETNLIFF